ncbi:hypothetical protein [Chrysiogenes arsenatis]|uniref:hypothetical protein n=1 Tax=Chrysiogenes arsenatis TaxID=309797 RepID=UPI0003F8D3FB|nr:hypothetical protein [Chrysiogenes arsenatis]
MEMLPQRQHAQMTITDPAAIAAAESVKARIQAAYIMAYQRPRDVEVARQNILACCRRPQFAERVEFRKPVGNSIIKGASIRFAEAAIREWGNIHAETQTVYEDDRVRRVKVTVIDLETNATFGREFQLNKTVERSNNKGREVVGERTNTNGGKVYIVKATEDELANKEAAQISKIIRNEGLRLIPSDIIDEAIEIAIKTLANRDAKDPKDATRKILDAFAELGVKPSDIEEYIGKPIAQIVDTERQDLRGIYQTIKSGEARWADYITPKEPENEPSSGEKPSGKKDKTPPPANNGEENKLAEQAVTEELLQKFNEYLDAENFPVEKMDYLNKFINDIAKHYKCEPDQVRCAAAENSQAFTDFWTQAQKRLP